MKNPGSGDPAREQVVPDGKLRRVFQLKTIPAAVVFNQLLPEVVFKAGLVGDITERELHKAQDAYKTLYLEHEAASLPAST